MKLKFLPKPEDDRKNWWLDRDLYGVLRGAIANLPCGNEDEPRVVWRLLDAFDTISKPASDEVDPRFPDLIYVLREEGGVVEVDEAEQKKLKEAWAKIVPTLPARFRPVIEQGDLIVSGKRLLAIRFKYLWRRQPR